MKFEMQERKNEESRCKAKNDIFGNIIIKVFPAVFLTMIAAQAIIINSANELYISDYHIKGEPLGYSAYLYEPCRLELRLINLDKCPDLKVLVNGEERASFETKSVLIELKDGDVVEIDASCALVLATVQISAVSGNISGLLGQIVHTVDGITPFAKIETG